jgi:hypothetical protein
MDSDALQTEEAAEFAQRVRGELAFKGDKACEVPGDFRDNVLCRAQDFRGVSTSSGAHRFKTDGHPSYRQRR